MFSQFHPKATKSRSKGAFSFATREVNFLKKKNCFLDPALWFDFWLLGGKSQNQKPNHHALIWISAFYVDYTFKLFS
jgi:hypothetical protein